MASSGHRPSMASASLRPGKACSGSAVSASRRPRPQVRKGSGWGTSSLPRAAQRGEGPRPKERPLCLRHHKPNLGVGRGNGRCARRPRLFSLPGPSNAARRKCVKIFHTFCGASVRQRRVTICHDLALHPVYADSEVCVTLGKPCSELGSWCPDCQYALLGPTLPPGARAYLGFRAELGMVGLPVHAAGAHAVSRCALPLGKGQP